MENDIHSKSSIAIKIIKILLKILYQILIIACVLLIFVIVLQRLSNSEKSIAGYRIFRVITGSMEPEYQIGEVVICKDIPADEIKVGDDIVYRGTYGEYAGKVIMHEVIKIDRDENNNLNFHAKGLHNSSVEDPQIKESQIYGIVKLKSRILAILYDLATNTYTAFVIITILVLNVFLSFKSSGKKDAHRLGEAKNEENYESDDAEEVDGMQENDIDNEDSEENEELEDDAEQDIDEQNIEEDIREQNDSQVDDDKSNSN